VIEVITVQILKERNFAQMGIVDFENTRAFRKVTSRELLTEQAMRKKHFIIYKKYVHT
jgi:hypothetical protein